MPEIPIRPPWIKDNAQATPEPTTERNAKGQYKSGVSGNPTGRTGPNKKTILSQRLSQELQDAASAVQAAVIQKALDGDTTAQSIVMARISPPLRGRAERIEFELNPDASIADQAKQIVTAVSRGEVDIDTARGLLDMLSAFCGLRDVETFLSELKKARNEHHSGVMLQ